MQVNFKVMKNLHLIIIAVLVMLSSCSNKVDIYSDEGDSTIVYAVLDAKADTNFFKITKSFIGNVNDLAQNYEANNYKFEEIDVTLSGVFAGKNENETVTLDTISKFIPYNENAVFYSGVRQTYYYTTKELVEGNEYELNIYRKADGVTISAKAKTINTFSFKKPLGLQISFDNNSNYTNTVEWHVTSYPFKSTASYFEVVSYFHYNEIMPGSTDIVHRSIKWTMGANKADNLYVSNTTFPYYTVSYNQSTLFSLLEEDEYLKNNSPIGVQRYFENFEFIISAMGEELYNYYLITNSSSAIQDVPNYSNVENGYGIMSSRVSKPKDIKLSESTRKKIVELFPDYGFIYDPNR